MFFNQHIKNHDSVIGENNCVLDSKKKKKCLELIYMKQVYSRYKGIIKEVGLSETFGGT